MGEVLNSTNVVMEPPGYQVLAVTEDPEEVVAWIETIRQAAACPSCGTTARTRGPPPCGIRVSGSQ